MNFLYIKPNPMYMKYKEKLFICYVLIYILIPKLNTCQISGSGLH